MGIPLDSVSHIAIYLVPERRYMTKPHKINVSYRLTDEEKKLVELTAKRLGVSETDVVKMAIRKLAREEGVSLEVDTRSASNVVQK